MTKDTNDCDLLIEFNKNQDILCAIGDETRQAIIIALLSGSQEPGMRVGEIKEKTYLSRPAVSHHLRILKDAKIISVLKEGTMNFYYLNSDSRLRQLKDFLLQLDERLSTDRKD